MNRRLLLIGAALLCLPLSAGASVYDTIRNNTREEAGLRKAEPIVRHFAAATFREAWDLRVSDIDQILQGEWSEVCSPQCLDESTGIIGSCPADNQSNLVREGFSDTECEEITFTVQSLVRDEEMLRGVARSMQLIATAQEEAIRETGGNPDSLFAIVQAILNIWQAGGTDDDPEDDSETMRVRFVEAKSVVDESALRAALADVQAALAALPITIPVDSRAQDAAELVAAYEDSDDLTGGWDEDPPTLTVDEQLTDMVWRYQFGARLVAGFRYPTYLPPDPVQPELSAERQYVFWRWEPLETALMNLWSLFPTDATSVNPPLQANEIISYTMPENALPLFPSISVWVRMDQDSLHPEGDAGLGWVLPTEPVMPSLLADAYLECIRGCGAGDACSMSCAASTNGMLLAGTYPPEPSGNSDDEEAAAALGDGRGLCSQPFARRGYLCKVLEGEDDNDCLEQIQPTSDSIVLAQCTVDSRDGVTETGADPCADLDEWSTEIQAGDNGDEWPGDARDGFEEDEERYSQLWFKIGGLDENGEDPNDEEGDTVLGADYSERPFLERPERLCTVGQQRAYGNSIGNNLCYAAACVEESFEWHTISWLRTPFTTGDKSYFFPVPQQQSAGSLTMIPAPPAPLSKFPLPPYTPERLALLIESDLCQSNGLPPLLPPSRCLFDTRRAFVVGSQVRLDGARAFIAQPNQITLAGPESLALPTGVRIGAQLYADYLEDLSRPLTKLLEALVTLLTQMTTFTLPSEMCPLGPST